jgi:ComF family protein
LFCKKENFVICHSCFLKLKVTVFQHNEHLWIFSSCLYTDYAFKFVRVLKQKKNASYFFIASICMKPCFLQIQKSFPQETGFVFVPIPSNTSSKSRRDFSQSLELCKQLSSITQQKTLLLLENSRETHKQALLSRKERLKNKKESMACNKKLNQNNRKIVYLLIDDIVTTGATLCEAQRALQKAGAVHVFALTFCYGKI